MDRALLTAAPAFAAGCRSLSRLAASSSEAARALACGDITPDAATVVAVLPVAEATSARAAVDFVLRTVSASRPTPKQCKAALEAHTELTVPALEAVLASIVKADIIKPAGAELPPAPKDAVQQPSIDELAWTVGVASHASVAASLQQPYVVLDFRLRHDASGSAETSAASASAGEASAPAPRSGPSVIQSEKVELTLGQLAAVETTLRDALAALEKA